jgi:glycosyltransferase involved in cell wall biosynthesis
VIASSRPESERAEQRALSPGISVVRVPVGRTNWIGLGWQAARYLGAHRAEFDLVHFVDVHFAYAYREPFVASAFQSFRQRLTSHHGRPYHTSSRNLVFRTIYYQAARFLMEKPAVRRARHIIMPSVATQHEFVEHYGISRERTTLVYPGIDLDRFRTLPEQAAARQALGFPIHDRIILYVGFSTPRKGVEYLAQAMQHMKMPARLVMVGKWEAGYRARFLDALGSARPRVHIVGYIGDEDLLHYYAAADLFVLPTLLEGFGLPLVEAMAAGIPIVTTTGGSAAEVAGDASLVVRPGDSQALANAVDRALNEHQLAQRLSQAGKSRAHALFDQHRMAAELEEVYQSVVDAPGSNKP